MLVVGAVKDSRQIASPGQVHDLQAPASPEIYVPLWQHAEAGRDMALLLGTSSDPAALTEPVRRQVLAMDGEQPVYNVQTLEGIGRRSSRTHAPVPTSFTHFARIAFLTACIGLYAIVSYSVTQRTHEVGIRMALGAKPSDVLRLVTREATPLIVAGLFAGLTVSLGATRLMSNLLYGVPANDGATLLSVSLILAATAAIATYIPARRAVGVDPIVALRCE